MLAILRHQVRAATRLGAACLVLSLCSGAPVAAQVHVNLGAEGPDDDYICWGKVPAIVSFDSGDVLPDSVTISSAPHNVQAPVGQIGFSLTRSFADTLTDSIEVSIDPSTRSGQFFVAGTVASVATKDVKIVVRSSDGSNSIELPVMVRVRKNAETLTDVERDIFLQAFLDGARRNNQFAKYWGVHTDAVRMAHQVAFLPWHRVFLINLERELQLENPAVALPYWEFDKPAPRLFSTDFLGVVGNLPNPQEVEFSAANPLTQFRLTDPRVTPLTRRQNGDRSASDRINKLFFGEDQHGVMTSEIFGPYHGQAHVFIGGLVGDFERSPADPLFFLLHANVDRAWAAWQRHHDRFDRSDPNAYALQGSHSPGSGVIEGNFVDDTMWPWDNEMRPSEPVSITIGRVVLPSKVGAGEGVTSNPQVGDMLDYLDLIGDGSTHDYCYDTVPAGMGDVADFP